MENRAEELLEIRVGNRADSRAELDNIEEGIE